MKILTGTFDELREKALYVRETVFIKEQSVDPEIELDDKDGVSLHFVVEYENSPIATARVQKNGHIGRFAVLKPWRGKGIGLALLYTIIQTCKDRGDTGLFLNAQVQAIGFYEKFGFKTRSEIFYEANIAHKRMDLDCSQVSVPELVYEVDADNSIKSIVTRKTMREKHLGHRASYIVVCNSDNKFLIEIRTLSKDYAPGLFDACVGGIEQIFEDRFESASRELLEEVGIACSKDTLHYLGYEKIDSPPTYVLADMYFIKGSFITKRQSAEVSGVMYLDLDDIRRLEKNFAKDSYKAFFMIIQKARERGLL